MPLPPTALRRWRGCGAGVGRDLAEVAVAGREGQTGARYDTGFATVRR
jgi:hypothetical protein